MGLFQALDGEAVILREGGVYKQADLYSRDGVLFAKAAGGFIKLNANGSTSKPKIMVEDLPTTMQLWKGRFGWLLTGPAEGAVPHQVILRIAA